MKLPTLLCIACLLSACADSTPNARIQKAPEQYRALPPAHQQLVRERNLTRGMSMDAVYFAWGRPAMVTKEMRNGRESTRWDFARHKHVHRDVDAYTSYGRAFTNPSFPDQLTTASNPSRDPIPNRTATAWFIDGTLDDWEFIR